MPQTSPLNLAIIGPSGAGKGTHAASLSSRFNLRHVATGDLFREHVLNRTELGTVAATHIEHAELVPDEVVDAMIGEWCRSLPPDRGALLDGFPRTISQVRFLGELLQKLGRTLDAVIYLQVPDAQIVRRLSGRFVCRSCQEPFHLEFKPPQVYGVCDECGGQLYHRADDSSEMVAARLRVFHRTTNPVLDHYMSAGKLIILSGEGTLSEVDDRLVRTIEAVRLGQQRFATEDDVALLERPASAFLPAHRALPTTDIVLLGAPGSGKGTQAERLCTRLKLPHIATGELFRENLRRESDLGKTAKEYMDRGELVPDDVTEAMVAERLSRSDARDGYILDGFPRTLAQAHALNEMLARAQRRITGAIYIKVPDDVLVMRLSSRLICRQCQAPYHSFFKPPRRPGICDVCGGELYQRTDDNPKTVKARLTAFHHHTEPLIRFYRQAGLLHEVDGNDDIDEITTRMFDSIVGFAPKLEAAASAGR